MAKGKLPRTVKRKESAKAKASTPNTVRSRLRWVLSGLTLLVVVGGLAYVFRSTVLGIITPPPKAGNAINFVGGSKAADRRGDVIFIHGLDGDSVTTWGAEKANYYWPRAIHETMPDVGVYSIDYDAASSGWTGSPMAVSDRSQNLLDQLRLEGIGKRPIIFICHSLGGIVAKQMLQDGIILNKPKFEEIANQTKGIVFLATPHSGSNAAYLASILQMYRPNDSVKDLTRDDDRLQQLNTWYRENSTKHNVATEVYFETRAMPIVGMVVARSSADPGITGVVPVPVDADHISICKPTKENHVSKGVREFIEEHLRPAGIIVKTTLQEFLSEFESAKAVNSEMAALVAKYQGSRFVWEAYVKEKYPQERDDPKSGPAYIITVAPETRGEGFISAAFPRNDPSYDRTLPAGTKIRISGVLSENTNSSGIFLRDCRLEKDAK